jgi:hypothetical protein
MWDAPRACVRFPRGRSVGTARTRHEWLPPDGAHEPPPSVGPPGRLSERLAAWCAHSIELQPSLHCAVSRVRHRTCVLKGSHLPLAVFLHLSCDHHRACLISEQRLPPTLKAATATGNSAATALALQPLRPDPVLTRCPLADLGPLKHAKPRQTEHRTLSDYAASAPSPPGVLQQALAVAPHTSSICDSSIAARTLYRCLAAQTRLHTHHSRLPTS